GECAGERPARGLSYHTDFSDDTTNPAFIKPIAGRGPIEGRPRGEVFAHQRWDEFFPKVGYVFSLSQVAPGQNFFGPNNGSAPFLEPTAGWTYARAHTDFANPSGTLPPTLRNGPS